MCVHACAGLGVHVRVDMYVCTRGTCVRARLQVCVRVRDAHLCSCAGPGVRVCVCVCGRGGDGSGALTDRSGVLTSSS